MPIHQNSPEALLHSSTHTGTQEPRPSQNVSTVFFSLHLILTSLPTSNRLPQALWCGNPAPLPTPGSQAVCLPTPPAGGHRSFSSSPLPETSCCSPMSHCRLCTQLEQIEFAPHLFPLAMASVGKGGNLYWLMTVPVGKKKTNALLPKEKGLTWHPLLTRKGQKEEWGTKSGKNGEQFLGAYQEGSHTIPPKPRPPPLLQFPTPHPTTAVRPYSSHQWLQKTLPQALVTTRACWGCCPSSLKYKSWPGWSTHFFIFTISQHQL